MIEIAPYSEWGVDRTAKSDRPIDFLSPGPYLSGRRWGDDWEPRSASNRDGEPILIRKITLLSWIPYRPCPRGQRP